MIPAYQTINTSIKDNIYGNCASACIASILECDINEVPNVNDYLHKKGIKSYEEFKKTSLYMYWLYQELVPYLNSKGYNFCFTDDEKSFVQDGYCTLNFLIKVSEDGNFFTAQHSVVGFGTKMVFDPSIREKEFINLYMQVLFLTVEETSKLDHNWTIFGK